MRHSQQKDCPNNDGPISVDPDGMGIVECVQCGTRYHASCASVFETQGCYMGHPLVVRRVVSPSPSSHPPPRPQLRPASAPTPTSNRGSNIGVLTSVVLVFVVFIAIAIVVLTNLSTGAGSSGVNAPVPTLEQARTIIPQELDRIYQSLNTGDPQAIADLVTPQLLSSPIQLDSICRPYTYRAHYIEAIIEPSDGVFEARVHALFQPVVEQADVLRFAWVGGKLILQGIYALPDDWLGTQKDEAISAARKFIYAAKAGKKDILRQIVSPSLDISPLFEEPDYASRLQEINSISEERAGGFEQHDGLKIAVNVTTGRQQICGDLWHFLVDTTGNKYKIVEWEFVPMIGCYRLFQFPSNEKHVDPNLENYTLKRFGLLHQEASASDGPNSDNDEKSRLPVAGPVASASESTTAAIPTKQNDTPIAEGGIADSASKSREPSPVTPTSTEPDQAATSVLERAPYVSPASPISPASRLFELKTDADRRGTIVFFSDRIEYRDDGMGTGGGHAPYGPNADNNFVLPCSDIVSLKAYGFRPVIFGSNQIVISSRQGKFHIPTLHSAPIMNAIYNTCHLNPPAKQH